MKTFLKTIFYLVFTIAFLTINVVFALAEDLPSGVIPKLPTTPNDPVLDNGHVYPSWGPVCQSYTYSVIYSDKEGRSPEYVKMYFNGKMLDMEKEKPGDNNFQQGVKYIYKNVPNKFGSNFYYFEASNGLGKTRDSIIDSPDNGPVLFDSDFQNNEIVLIDHSTSKDIWRFPTKDEWIGGVVFSSDGKYLVAQTSRHVYLFDTSSNTPLWEYKSVVQNQIGGDVKGGVAISENGDKVFAALNNAALMFENNSNKPIWTYNLEQNGGSAYAVDISQDGKFFAVAMAGSETDENSNVLLLLDSNGKKLWQYHSSGNWHDVDFSHDGKFITGSTGCPDRRGYLFSVDSNIPIIKSEPLSAESPIDEARVSADGNSIAFGAESGYGAVILMDKNSKQILWEYDTPQSKTVRALAITPDGQKIGAGTFGGDILIFNKDSSDPIQHIKIETSIGAFDLADDGSFFATGSTDKKVRIFEKGSNQAKAEVDLNEYVGELDISANGKYIVAGTSGSVYFFDMISDLDQSKIFPCETVIEPEAESAVNTAINKLEPVSSKAISQQFILSFVSAGILVIGLLAYIFISVKRKSSNKNVIIGLTILIVLLIGLCIYFRYFHDNTSSINASCGDTFCEPEAGENKNNCIKDCDRNN